MSRLGRDAPAAHVDSKSGLNHLDGQHDGCKQGGNGETAQELFSFGVHQAKNGILTTMALMSLLRILM